MLFPISVCHISYFLQPKGDALVQFLVCFYNYRRLETTESSLDDQYENTPEKGPYPAIIQSLATIGPPAKRQLNDVSLAGR